MGQIKAGSLEKGMFLEEKNAPYLVAEREFVNPGKGSAFVRLKLKNMRNGSVLKLTYKSQDNVQEIDVEDVEAQYLYSDDQTFYFMNTDTYDQFEIKKEGLEDKAYFMLDGETFKVVLWGDEALDIKLPPKKDLIVTDAPEAVKGDTVQGATKMVTVETGLQVKVPIFIKEGEKIRINVETKEYQERINN